MFLKFFGEMWRLFLSAWLIPQAYVVFNMYDKPPIYLLNEGSLQFGHEMVNISSIDLTMLVSNFLTLLGSTSLFIFLFISENRNYLKGPD